MLGNVGGYVGEEGRSAGYRIAEEKRGRCRGTLPDNQSGRFFHCTPPKCRPNCTTGRRGVRRLTAYTYQGTLACVLLPNSNNLPSYTRCSNNFIFQYLDTMHVVT